jgi:hypothetical protein
MNSQKPCSWLPQGDAVAQAKRPVFNATAWPKRGLARKNASALAHEKSGVPVMERRFAGL